MAEKFRVKTSDGEVFRGWYWEAEEARANLNIITGMDEYAFRYDAFAMGICAAFNIFSMKMP